MKRGNILKKKNNKTENEEIMRNERAAATGITLGKESIEVWKKYNKEAKKDKKKYVQVQKKKQNEGKPR